LQGVREDVEDEIKTNTTTNATNNYEDFLMKKSLIMPSYILNNNEKNGFNRNDEYGIDDGVCDDNVEAVVYNEKISNANKKMMIEKSIDNVNPNEYTITQIIEHLEGTPVANSPSDTQKNIKLGDIEDIFDSDDDLFAEVPSSSSGKENKVADAQKPQTSSSLTTVLNEVNKSPSIFCVKARRSIHQQNIEMSPAMLDDTIRCVPLKNRRAINSDSSDNEISGNELVTEDFDDDAVFETCRTVSIKILVLCL
jgi:hypothetical protein